MALPRPVLVTDMVVDTSYKTRRTRFYWEPTVAPTGLTQLEACCNRLMATIGSTFASNFCTTQVKVLRFEGFWYGSGSAGFEANSTVAAIQGAHAAVTPGSDTEDGAELITDTLPDDVVLIIQKRTGNTGRAQMGRWFFSGLTEKVQNHGVLSSAFVDVAKTFADSLSDSITVSSGFASVLHARHYNRLDSSLMPITKCYALKALGSRMERRRPLELERA